MNDEEPICEECGERPATWHLTEFVDGQPVQHHYCDKCYGEKEGSSAILTPQIAFAQLLAALAPELKEMAGRQCPVCGINYLEFRQNTRLGCPHDYQVFKSALEELIQRIHGATEHCGKAPPEAGKRALMRRQIHALQKEQQEAVAAQRYEQAAELRDRIQEMKEQTNEPDEPDG